MLLLCRRYRDANPEPEDEALLHEKPGLLTQITETVRQRPVQSAMAVGVLGGVYSVYSEYCALGACVVWKVLDITHFHIARN